MARRHRMTPRRRAALRKAQLASAKKRSRGLTKRRVAAGIGVAAAIGTTAYLGSRKHSTIRRKQAAVKALSGRRVTLTVTTPMSGQYSSSGVSRPGFGQLQIHHPSRTRGLRISSIGGMGISASTLTGSRTPSRVPKIDKDAIPLYNPDNSKSWPGGHGGGDKRNRKRNKKMRKQGLIE